MQPHGGDARSQPSGLPAPAWGHHLCMPRAILQLQGSSAPAMGSACRALAGKWHGAWAAAMPSQAQLAGMSQAIPVCLLCPAFLNFCHERLQAGDLVLPLCPARAAIAVHTGNKSGCLPGGDCTAPAAAAPISQYLISPGCLRAAWVCAACPNCPSSLSVTGFCQRPSSVPVSRSSPVSQSSALMRS